MPTPELTYKRILTFWLPLAGTWFMMAVEGPFLAAVIARLPGPAENLAAFGVAFAVAIFTESPVIMLMAASTALVEDHQSYLALRRFAYGLSAALTLCMLVMLLPPIFEFLSGTLLRLDEDIGRLTHAGLALLIPWPAAIAYRRLRQGLLIRHNLTRLVAAGTVIRLATMSLTAVIWSRVPQLSGVVVATAALSAGVLVEALASRLMTRRIVSQLPRPEEGQTAKTPLTVGRIVTFYSPLALTSLLALAVQPLVTFFIGRSRLPRESLAVLPVITGLVFIFRSVGLSYQEVGIALLGERREHYERLRNFAVLLGLAASTGLGVIAFSPLSTLWFQKLSGLSADLTGFALLPTRLLTILPALSVLLSLQRSLLVHARQTTSITGGSAIESIGVFLILRLAIYRLDMIGAVAAAVAIVLGRMLGNLWLVLPCWKAIRARRPRS